jgi:hypothetical protein
MAAMHCARISPNRVVDRHNRYMPRLERYPFRFRDPLTGTWVRVRYVAERHEIAAGYAEWEITGPPEIREVDPSARYFNPVRDDRRVADASIGDRGPFRSVAAIPVRQDRCVALVGFAS